MEYEEITLDHLEQLAALYIETFNAPPWNDRWTKETAEKRLHQMICTEDSFGLCAYENSALCGAILGCMEQFYDGQMFNIKEFWVKNDLRRKGIGSRIFAEFERRLRERGIGSIILFTIKGDQTEHFYHKQQMKSNPNMVFMEKQL